ncbi:WcbI family polysaccharide biosynthesis putative acetyltransferase [Pectobacterium actinidiae]|uniref:WcbI family polysaccharide biosynthesis putative acetyltransferase n=1 Tax=Pectobacterium actinidiae TaxID=1507808 RepID=UPI002A7F6B87|nr:WcbI family polysaccharide biosynthesis putative acetyltransferase [Pectobacterium actinidiae]MDY4315412.1 WcbI family polysaccharide biosynthesis putative acetyltransferase [Pectobacterium actinidiae]
MRVALVGNCQLEIIGELLKSNKNISGNEYNYIFNTPIYKLKEKADVINFYHELESCDVIFMQYHSERWGSFSTSALERYFDIKMLPTMESRVSSPQLAYFDKELPDLMVYVDYRFLHLYLSGFDYKGAIEKYHSVVLSQDKKYAALIEDTDKYKALYDSGKLIFDYSDYYLSSLSQDQDCFSTISHPSNKHLSLLFESIHFNTFGVHEAFNLNGQELLNNYRAPRLGSGDQSYYMMRDSGLQLACKINYSFFDKYSRTDLVKALISSNYYNVLDDEYMDF